MDNSQKKDKYSWFERNPRKTIFSFIIIVFVILFCCAELLLRLAGEKPGVNLPSKRLIKSIEELEVINPFFTDEKGIFKANKNYYWEDGKYGIGVKINSDGFRSKEFKKYDTENKKILFLGDSFTWGASARPITNCFVDLIAREGYLTFNTGIPGTDPNQYAYLAEKYVPLLKPDIVIVMFYMGNDINKKPDSMIPNKDLFYISNDVWLYAFDENGNHLSLKESFHRYYYRDYSPAVFKNKLKYFFMSTVIGKKIWLFIKSVKDYRKKSLKRKMTNESFNLLAQIKQVVNENNAKFMLFIIPIHPKADYKTAKKKEILYAFKKLDPFIPDFLSTDDYNNLPDGHLNNSGHFKMSEFIISTIKKEYK